MSAEASALIAGIRATREERDALTERLRIQLDHAVDALASPGDAFQVDVYGPAAAVADGARGYVVEELTLNPGGRLYYHCRFYLSTRPGPFSSIKHIGGHRSYPSSTVLIRHGVCELLATDGVDTGIAVRIPDSEDLEAAHHRDVGRLRTLARHDELRVSVRDRAVKLLDPAGIVLHEGDVRSAFLFLAGIDVDQAALAAARRRPTIQPAPAKGAAA